MRDGGVTSDTGVTFFVTNVTDIDTVFNKINSLISSKALGS
jgi:hypothetical protein